MDSWVDFLYINVKKNNVEKRGTCIYVCMRACVLLQQCSVLLSSSAAIYLTPPSECTLQRLSILERSARLPPALKREA